MHASSTPSRPEMRRSYVFTFVALPLAHMLSKSQAFTLGAFGSHVHDMATFAYVGVADPKTTLGGVVIPVDVAIVWLEVQDLPACFEGPQESSPREPVLSCEIDRLRVDIIGGKNEGFSLGLGSKPFKSS